MEGPGARGADGDGTELAARVVAGAWAVKEGPGEVMSESYDYVSRCPACGDPIDFCQGHGAIGDPFGHTILEQHDDGDHSLCSPEGCEEASGADDDVQ